MWNCCLIIIFMNIINVLKVIDLLPFHAEQIPQFAPHRDGDQFLPLHASIWCTMEHSQWEIMGITQEHKFKSRCVEFNFIKMNQLYVLKLCGWDLKCGMSCKRPREAMHYWKFEIIKMTSQLHYKIDKDCHTISIHFHTFPILGIFAKKFVTQLAPIYVSNVDV